MGGGKTSPFFPSMAIDRSIKRVVARNGQVYFYQYGKRISYKKGIVKFFKQNENKIKELGEQAIPKITDKEKTSLKRSQAAKDRYYYDDGKGKRKYVDKGYMALLKATKLSQFDTTERNLAKYETPKSKIRIFPRYSDILRTVTTEYLRNQDIFKDFEVKKGRFRSKDTGNVTPTIESLTDIAELIGEGSAFANFKISYIDMQGDEITGRKRTMNYIVKFQNEIMGKINNTLKELGVLTRFLYRPIINTKNKTIVFDFTDTTDETFEERLAYEANRNNVTRTRSGGITIANKYKGVIIEMDFS